MQLEATLQTSLYGMFQSSSPPRKGCNTSTGSELQISCGFQSSSPPRKGCNTMIGMIYLLSKVSILIPSEEGMQRSHIYIVASSAGFQSSSPPRKGCNYIATICMIVYYVSILIPSEEGMQLAVKVVTIQIIQVSILIPSEEGMQRHFYGYFGYFAKFQSSSPPRKGCNIIY